MKSDGSVYVNGKKLKEDYLHIQVEKQICL
nr:hypothetical protein [Clostridium perfringens]